MAVTLTLTGFFPQLGQAASAPPTILSYQGRLADSSGTLLGGSGTTYYFKFSLWDSATVGAGTRVWPTAAPATTTASVRQGAFTVNIGDTTNGYPDALTVNFANYPALYLQIEVSSDNNSSETLGPRQQLTSAMYAQVAGAVTGTTTPSVFGTTTPATSSFVTIQATSSTAIPLSLLGAAGQTANLFQIQNNLLQNLFSVSSAGAVTLGSTFAVTGASTHTGLASFNGSASTTQLSVNSNFLYIGTSATSTLQGATTGTSTLQGFLTVLGVNSTSTFSGGLAATYLNLTGASATSTALTGFDIAGGCFAINHVCVGGSGGGAVSSVSNADGTLTISPTTGAVVASLALGHANAWTALQNFTNASTSKLTATSSVYLATLSGSVAIGTTSQNALLTVWGSGSRLLEVSDNASSTILVVTNGSTATDRVGIGTSTPYSRLSVWGYDTLAGTSAFNVSNNASTTLFAVNDDGSTYLSGNVGIGTTSPYSKLTVWGTNATAGTYSFLVSNSASTTGFAVDNAGNGYIATKFGIGTSTPQWNLQVAGTRPSIVLSDMTAAANNHHWLVSNMGGNFLLGTSTDAFGTSTPAVLTMSNAGNVGIGTSTPAARLAVAQGTEVYSFLVSNNASSTPSFAIQGTNGNGRVLIGTTTVATSSSARLFVGSAAVTNSVAYFYNSAGWCGINPVAAALVCSSDIRLKKNIQPLLPALENIMKLIPVIYNWNVEATGTPTHTGFIAQQVEPILPDLVDEDVYGIKSVNYSGLTPYLVSAVQEVNFDLQTIASTTASSTPESQSFASSFFSNLFSRMTGWLADAQNGIHDLFANTIHAKDTICVDDQCLTKDDVRALLQMVHAGDSSAPPESVPPDPPPADAGATTPEQPAE